MTRAGRLFCHRRGWLVLGISLLVVAGCGAIGPNRAGAEQAARRFHAALDHSDGIGACRLLAHRAIEEVESSEDKPCAQAIGDESIPAAGPVESSVVYGREARVVLHGDIVFLSLFKDGWKVVAAGCTPRINRPYHCDLKGE